MESVEGRRSENAPVEAQASQGAPTIAPMDARTRFEAGVKAALAGDWTRAKRHLRSVVAAEPAWAEAWAWLAALTDNTWEAISCLTRALEANPHHKAAQEGLRWARCKLAAGQPIGPMEAPFAQELAAQGGIVPEGGKVPACPRQGEGGETAGSPSAPEEPPKASPPSQALPARDFRLPFPRLAGAVTLVAILALTVGGLIIPTLGQSLEMPASLHPAATATPGPRAWLEAQWPAVEAAKERGRWSEAIALLEEMRAMAPFDADVQEALLNAYLQEARALVAQGLPEEALMYVERAVALRPDDMQVQRERQAAQFYLEGMRQHQAGNWPAAVEALRRVFELDPSYRDVRDMLYSAYLNLGLAERAAGSLGAARKAFDNALQVRPDGEEARNRYREVMVLLFPTPTPTPLTDKRIEVDISEQHFYAYEGDRLVYEFVCSTGAHFSPTAPGRYRVLDKIPMAYASTWNLQMPYWLGIYWSGTLENGIHALPILSNGQILWDGYLGQRVSYGCIILSTEAAKIIYDWAEVGTPVIIRN